MNAYRTIDPTARIEQLEGENAVLRLKVDALAEALAMSVGEGAGKAREPKKESKPMPTWSKFLVASVASLLAAGCLAQAGLLWVAAAASGVGVVLLVCLAAGVRASQ